MAQCTAGREALTALRRDDQRTIGREGDQRRANKRTTSDRMSEQARDALGSQELTVLADRGYYSGEEIWCRRCSPVTVLVRENDETFDVTADQAADLLRALSEADRGDVIASEQLLKDLRSRTN